MFKNRVSVFFEPPMMADDIHFPGRNDTPESAEASVSSGGGSSRSGPTPSEARKRRQFAPKVKSGCITCKKRHVKCDEAKPKCMRCTLMDWECEGYTTPPPRSSRSPSRSRSKARPSKSTRERTNSAPQQGLVELFGTPEDSRALTYFVEVAAPKIAAFSHLHDFWVNVLPSASWLYPPVKHALVAVAASVKYVHNNPGEDVFRPGQNVQKFLPDQAMVLSSWNSGYQPDTEDEDYQQSWTQYNKAIQMILDISDPSSQLEVILLTCMLFVIFEGLNGRPAWAARHLQSGARFLHEWRDFRHTSLPAHRNDFLRNQLMPVYHSGLVYAYECDLDTAEQIVVQLDTVRTGPDTYLAYQPPLTLPLAHERRTEATTEDPDQFVYNIHFLAKPAGTNHGCQLTHLWRVLDTWFPESMNRFDAALPIVQEDMQLRWNAEASWCTCSFCRSQHGLISS